MATTIQQPDTNATLASLDARLKIVESYPPSLNLVAYGNTDGMSAPYINLEVTPSLGVGGFAPLMSDILVAGQVQQGMYTPPFTFLRPQPLIAFFSVLNPFVFNDAATNHGVGPVGCNCYGAYLIGAVVQDIDYGIGSDLANSVSYLDADGDPYLQVGSIQPVTGLNNTQMYRAAAYSSAGYNLSPGSDVENNIFGIVTCTLPAGTYQGWMGYNMDGPQGPPGYYPDRLQLDGGSIYIFTLPG
jgi:hypothetical protein